MPGELSDFDKLRFLVWGTELIGAFMRASKGMDDVETRAAALRCAMGIISGIQDSIQEKNTTQLARDLLAHHSAVDLIEDSTPDVIAALRAAASERL